MSSHREAPGIAKDPVADSTDLYAFVSPDHPDTVTLIANYIPLEGPAGGPNFYEFGDDVRYDISVDNDGDIESDVRFEFRFTTIVKNKHTFLYNTGPITSLGSANWNRVQTYSVTMHRKGHAPKVLGTGLACPPVNIGPRSTPDYAALAAAAVHDLPGGAKVFAGQRREGFFVDLGSIFDLGDLRPFQNLHLIPTMAAPGVDATKAFNVHSIAIRVPTAWLTRKGAKPTDPAHRDAVIGVWTSAWRRKARVHEDGHETQVGPWRQVSRLGNPLINEVIIPMAHKDRWNSRQPGMDSDFQAYVQHPELAGLIPVLYPGVFPHLAAYSKPRADLMAILMTGIPSGVVAGFQNFTGPVVADLLRLNVAIPPSSAPSTFGILGGDLAGYPNGRRVFDDTVAIELRAVGGATIPLVDPSFTADGAASLLTDGTSAGAGRYMSAFPYLGVPLDGYDTPAS
ncbi:MAG TPA: DUF4331 domain-containing protein [Candidatus Limnocylindrales bacterium]